MYFLNYVCMKSITTDEPAADSETQLDRSNLTNAYVTGMEEDLHFKGNELTQITTVFTCG